MSFKPIPGVDVKTSYIEVAGTIDLVSPALKIPSGVAIDSGNFVPEITGGAKRIGGYERYDGHTSPSAAVYYAATVDTTSLLAVGNTITGVTSSQTAVVLYIESATVAIVTRVSGTFTPGETLNVSGAPKAVLTSMVESGTTTQTLNVTYLSLAAAEYRTSIAAVPGTGSVLGVWNFQGTIIAFRNNAANTYTDMYKATATGWVQVTTGVPSTLVKGGRYEFVNHNFSGASTGMKVYGCDGKNKGFSWDGTTYVEITTTGSPETPQHVAAHKNRLFYSINGSVMISAPGDPSGTWVAASTAGEIGTGDLITAMMPLPGNNSTGSLAVYGRNKTSILYGASTDTWNMANVGIDSGAIAYTVQYVGGALALDDRGVTSLTAVQEFGNFAASSISKAVQPFIDSKVGLAIASSVLRSQDQYRIYFTDGTGLAFRPSREGPSAVMPFTYPDAVTCICSGENSSGVEVVYFGSDNGMVYQAEKGTSFDGSAIDAWIRLSFNAERGPLVIKKWRRATVEADIPSYVALSMTYEMDYGDSSFPIVALQTSTQEGGGGYWDQFTWDEFTWDSPIIGQPKFSLSGSSQNISLLFNSNDDLSQPYSIQSVLLQYTPRRIKR